MATAVAPSPPHSKTSSRRRRESSILETGRWIGAIEYDPLRMASAPLLPGAIAFAIGILLARWYWFSPAWTAIAILLMLCTAVIAVVLRVRTAVLAVACVWLLIGIFAAELQPRPEPQRALRLLAQGAPATLTGTVERTTPVRHITSLRPFSTEEIVEQMQSVDLRLAAAGESGDPPQPLAGGVRLSLYAPEDASVTPLECGDLVTVTATIRPPERYRDPGVWDSPAWLLGQGIGVIGSGKFEKAAVAHRAGRRSFSCLLHTLQTAASSRLVQFAEDSPPHRMPAWLLLHPEDAAMLAAMVTGDRSYLSSRLRTPFERTGSFHLLVVSGLHLGIFAGFVFAVGRRLRIGGLPLTGITLLLSLAYALLSGFGQPVQRALAMVSLYLVGRLLYRDRKGLNSLGFATLCLLVFNPAALFDAGLQMTLLTVVAVAGIAIPVLERTTAPFLVAARSIAAVGMDTAFAPRLAQFRVTLRLVGEHLEPLLSRHSRRTRRAQSMLAAAVRGSLLLFDLCVLSATIELVMALPMAIYFHRVTTWGVPVNVLIVPALSLLLPAALLTMAVLLVLPHLAWLPATGTALLLHAVLAIVRTSSEWRMSEWRMPGPDLPAGCAAVACLAFAVWAVRRHSRRALPMATAALVAAAACALTPHHPHVRQASLEVTAIDVGQGDSIVVVSPDGRTMLVDAGGPTGGSTRQGNFEIGEDVVSPYLWARGIRRLDVVALTHAHSDHMGGMAAVLRNFHPHELWVGHNPPTPAYAALLEQAAALGIRVRSLSAGDSPALGQINVTVLSPSRDYQPADKAKNDDSLVLHLGYAGHAALLEGDAEAPSEASMLALPPAALAADLLKVGHHGSKTSTMPPFLARVAPHVAVISVGPLNSYHHPRWETLDKLQKEGARTWRTDLLGASTFYIDSDGVTPAPRP